MNKGIEKQARLKMWLWMAVCCGVPMIAVVLIIGFGFGLWTHR